MTDEYNRALSTSFRILGKKAYSVKEIEKKLINFTYSRESVDLVIKKLLELGFLNDDDYARLIVESYSTRGYGKLRIRQELYKRGIENETITELLSEFSANLEIICNFYDQKLKSDVSDYKLINKTKAFLQRKGFTFDEIDKGFSLYKESLEE